MGSSDHSWLRPHLSRAWGRGETLFGSRRARQQELRNAGILIGTDARGNEVRVPLDELCAHGLIVGKSRRGKSKLLYSIAAQLLAMGVTLVVIDPKKDLYNAVLALLVRMGKLPEQVALIDPSADDIVGVNALTIPEGGSAEATAVQTIEMLAKLTRDDAQGLWLREYGSAAVAPVAAFGHSLVDVYDFVGADSRYREAVLADVAQRDILKDRIYFDKWKELAQLKPDDAYMRTSSLRTRIGIIRQSNLRRMLGATKTTVDFPRLLDTPGTAVLANLALGQQFSATEARALGTTLLNQIASIAWSRSDTPLSLRNRVVVLVDEAERIVDGTLSDGYEKYAGLGISFDI